MMVIHRGGTTGPTIFHIFLLSFFYFILHMYRLIFPTTFCLQRNCKVRYQITSILGYIFIINIFLGYVYYHCNYIPWALIFRFFFIIPFKLFLTFFSDHGFLKNISYFLIFGNFKIPSLIHFDYKYLANREHTLYSLSLFKCTEYNFTTQNIECPSKTSLWPWKEC